MPLTWTEEHRTGVLIFDEQHKQLIDSINLLYKAINEGCGESDFNKLLDNFVEYGQVHFATEEKYFDEYGYPAAEEHKQEHYIFKAKMEEFLEKSHNYTTELAFELLEYMEDWLIKHILDTDHKYIAFFKEKGLVENDE